MREKRERSVENGMKEPSLVETRSAVLDMPNALTSLPWLPLILRFENGEYHSSKKSDGQEKLHFCSKPNIRTSSLSPFLVHPYLMGGNKNWVCA